MEEPNNCICGDEAMTEVRAGPSWAVYCVSCPAEVVRPTKAEAIKSWNEFPPLGLTRTCTTERECIDCFNRNAYDRVRDGVHEIYCPDCGAVFGEANYQAEDDEQEA